MPVPTHFATFGIYAASAGGIAWARREFGPWLGAHFWHDNRAVVFNSAPPNLEVRQIRRNVDHGIYKV
jgi:hypothetical protein